MEAVGDPRELPAAERDVMGVTRWFTAALERIVRRNPEQVLVGPPPLERHAAEARPSRKRREGNQAVAEVAQRLPRRAAPCIQVAAAWLNSHEFSYDLLTRFFVPHALAATARGPSAPLPHPPPSASLVPQPGPQPSVSVAAKRLICAAAS